MRTSSRVAFAFAWLVDAVTVVLAWEKVLAVPDGRGAGNGLLVATVCGEAGLILLMAWLREYERRLRTTLHLPRVGRGPPWAAAR